MPPCHPGNLRNAMKKHGLMADKMLIREAIGWPGAMIMWGFCQSKSSRALYTKKNKANEKRLKKSWRGLASQMSTTFFKSFKYFFDICFPSYIYNDKILYPYKFCDTMFRGSKCLRKDEEKEKKWRVTTCRDALIRTFLGWSLIMIMGSCICPIDTDQSVSQSSGIDQPTPIRKFDWYIVDYLLHVSI